jgi:hypothetical protein
VHRQVGRSGFTPEAPIYIFAPNPDEAVVMARGIEASPPSIVKLFGIAREATAARDCINKGDAATACKHWEGLLVQIKKIGSPVSESEIEIEKLMRQHNCKKF